MRKSSRYGVIDSVWLSGAQDGVQDVDASAGQGDEGLVVSFAFGAFAVVEDPAAEFVTRRRDHSDRLVLG